MKGIFFLVVIALRCHHPMQKIATLELASGFALQMLLDILAGTLELATVASRL